MKEALFIFGVLAIVLALTVFRYRRQIGMIFGVWRSVRELQNQAKSGREIPDQGSKADRGPLVRCSKCGEWVTESRAVSLGRSVYFCSTACLERSSAV